MLCKNIKATWKVITGILIFCFTGMSKPALTFCTVGANTVDSGSYRTGLSTVEMRGIGAGLAKKSDNALLVFGITSGDFDIDAYCSIIDDTTQSTETGLTARADTSDNAPFIALLIKNETEMMLKYRTETNKNCKSVQLSSSVYRYLRLKRAGNQFFIYCKSVPSDAWYQMSSAYVLDFPSVLLSGIMHASGSESEITRSRYEYINNLPEEPQAGSACDPLLFDFNSGVPLTTLGFTDIQNWSLSSSYYIYTDIVTLNDDSAHIQTPPFIMPLGNDTVTASWKFNFAGDTMPYLFDYALYSEEDMTLNHRTVINADRIGSAAKVVAGIDDTLHTNIIASDSIFIYDRTKVYGDVTTGRYCVRINDPSVYGTITENADVQTPTLPSRTITYGSVSTTVGNYDSLNLSPGDYDTLLINAFGKVRFSSGVYNFSRLVCYPDVRLYLDTDAEHVIEINIQNKLELADRTSMIVPDSSVAENITIFSNQTSLNTFGTDLSLTGIFILPEAEVSITSRGTIINGGLYARKISFEPDVMISFLRFPIQKNVFTTTLTSDEDGAVPYVLEMVTHYRASQDTITDILLKRDTTVIASMQTGVPTIRNRWQEITIQLFNDGSENKLRALYDNGASTIVAFDTIPFDNDTLSSLTYDYYKRDPLRPLDVYVDNISLSCTAEECPPVVIITQPVDVAVYENTIASFVCSVSVGASIPSYQWYRNDTAVAWANSSVYTVNNPDINLDGAIYYCRITGECDVAETDHVTLTVRTCIPPQITAQPSDTTVMLNTAARFSVTAQGIGLTYQWQVMNTDIVGANDSVFFISSVQPSHNRDRYRVLVTNDCGLSTLSDEAILTIPDAGPCKITMQPKGATLLEGDMYRTSVSTECVGGTYTWYQNNSIIPAATTESLVLGPVTLADDGSEIFCVVQNGITVDTSDTVNLYVRSPAASGGSMALSGVLYDADGEKAGGESGEQFDFRVTLFSRKAGGTPLYRELFIEEHAAYVIDGNFTLTLGHGRPRDIDSLQRTVSAYKDLYTEIEVGKDGGYEIVSPRLRLSAVPYALNTGIKVIYSSGEPDSTVSAPLGTMYVDESDSSATWKLMKTGWVKLE